MYNRRTLARALELDSHNHHAVPPLRNLTAALSDPADGGSKAPLTKHPAVDVSLSKCTTLLLPMVRKQSISRT